MRDFLYEKLNKNPIVDNTNKNINATIGNYIKYDYLFYVFPILSKIDLTINSEYFKANNISINKSLPLNSDELKTISYLAPFFKEKIRYNPKNIIRYLAILGYKTKQDDIVIACLKNQEDININDFIAFEEYLTLPDYETIINKITTLCFAYQDGFDIGFDMIRMI